jgi:4'-phosphopantetheinyl transferase
VARVAVRFETLDVDDATLAALALVVDADERTRAACYRFARDRRRFIVRRARLRLALGACVGVAPQALVFTANAYGKPVLPGGPKFSLSHAGDRMMLAVGDDEVGCDLERLDDELDWRPIAEGLFTPGERAALAALSPPAGRRGFFACWTRKEAFVKALGLGLSYPLAAFDVSVGARASLRAGGEGWAIAAPPAPPGFTAALVARDDGTPLVIAPLADPALAAAA